MCEELTASMRQTIRSAAKKLTGACRRQFQAEVAMRYCQGSPRRAEETFGWGRDAVNKGLHELRSGISCVDNFSARGRRKTEEKYPEIACRREALVDPESQADPKFQTPLAFTRMTAQAVRDQLAADGCNPIERCWGILENHWNGTLLTSIDTAIRWAQTMTWRGVSPVVHLLDRIYDKGVTVSRSAFRPIATRLERSAPLAKWSVVIHPHPR